MIQVDVRVKLSEFALLRSNEPSDDEPFLWLFYLKADGETVGDVLGHPERAGIELHAPGAADGGHGNLGRAAENENRGPFAIPSGIGEWETSLRFDPTVSPAQLAQYCCLGVGIVALEEDGTTDRHAREAHRRVVEQIRAELTAELRRILRDVQEQVFRGERVITSDEIDRRLRAAIAPQRVRAIIEELRDELVPLAVVRTIFNLFLLPFTIAEADSDELVGQRMRGPFFLPSIVANAVDGADLESNLSKDRNLLGWLEDMVGRLELPAGIRAKLRNTLLRSEDGKYRVSGNLRRTDLREPPTLGACWRPKDVVVFARGDERNAFHNRSLDGGLRWKGWERIPQGSFSSGLGAAASPDGKQLHLFGRGMDHNVWGERSSTGLEGLRGNFGVMPALRALYGPGVALAADGKRLHVFATDEAHRVRWSYSKDFGGTWHLPWGLCGLAELDSSPAVAVSTDGQHLHVVGLGRDRRIWRAHSPDGGVSWEALWAPVKDSEFRSAPGIATSASGSGVVVAARGRRHFYFLTSHDAGVSWEQAKWNRIRAGGDELPGGDEMQEEGYFVSAPAVCASPDLGDIHVFGVFSDLHVYHARSRDRGASWSGWHEVGERVFF